MTSVAVICEAVAAWSGLSARTIRRGVASNPQGRKAKQAAIYLADRLSGLGRPGIAAEFATTRTDILHALGRAGERLAREPDFARDLATLENGLLPR